MKSFLPLIVILLLSFSSHAQERATITTQKLSLRNGLDKNSSIILILLANDTVSVIKKYTNGWCKVNCKDTSGFVFYQYLKTIDPYFDWEKKKYISGTTPECENIQPEYDKETDNYLKINIGSHTDVVAKLMQITDSVNSVCIRMVYVNSNETFFIRNIPQGNYYLKIAYGKDWRQKIIDGNCYGRFAKNALYEKGTDLLDYYIIKSAHEINIPSYEIWLDVVADKFQTKSFNANNVTEEEFNK